MKTIEHMQRLLFLLIAAMALLSGCGPSYSEMLDAEALSKELVTKAKSDIPSVRELHVLSPTAATELYWDQSKKETARVQVEDVIYDRYLLTMKVDIKVDKKARTIVSYGAPQILLLELVSVVGSPEGQIKEKYGDNIWITPDQWEKIVKAGGQFSAAGIEVNTNNPVENVSALKSRVRATDIK